MIDFSSIDITTVVELFLLLLIGIGPKIVLVLFGGLLTRLLHFSTGALSIAGGIILLIVLDRWC